MSALAQKTVILVTHQVEFLSAVDKILVTKHSSKFDESFLMHTCITDYVNKNYRIFGLLR